MREKLIELLRNAAFKSQDLCLSYGNWCDGCPYINEDAQGCRFAIMVDHLIANGVTVQKKGEWEIRIDDYDCEYAMCSVCCSVFYDGENDTFDIRPNFCPNCGADMRGNT